MDTETLESLCLPHLILALTAASPPMATPVRHFSCPTLLLQATHCPHLSSPIFSNLVDIDDVVSLSYGNFCGIRRERHALHHVALPAVLEIKTNLMSMNEREKKTHICPDRPRRLILRNGVLHFQRVIDWGTGHRAHGVFPTFMSAGLVENLSLRSPCSSYSRTTLSTVQTANLALFWDQAMQVTLAEPSCGGEELM